jgi:2-polyprenyl-3-methyl-5-hydroxy-6-metoxy-1,4-benzoquinol methylase
MLFTGGATMPDDKTTNSDDLNAQGRTQWNAKAQFWDELHGDDGNQFHRTLISPPVERLLALQGGERVLDIACGTGVLARRLAELGADVTGADFSDALLERARARGQQAGTPITYLQADATDEAALLALGVAQYDAVTCTMAFMDIADIAPLMRAVVGLLKPEGRFVFATAHPAFNSNNPAFSAEMRDEDGQLVMDYALKIRRYMDVAPTQQVGARGEPTSHLYYHRPLHELLNVAFEAGLVLDGIEEPHYPPNLHTDDVHLNWRHVWQMPPVLAGRLRLLVKS